MAVPYTFGSATTSIPLSQLDSNFATTITLGNTAIQLGNTVTTLNNMTLANVTVSSGNVTATNVTATNVTSPLSTALTLQSNAGNTAVTIDTSQNVGIGTTGPSCRLDVQNATQKTAITGTGFGVLNLKSTTATGDYAALTFSSSAGLPGAVMAYQQTASGGQIAFGISNNYGSGITSEAVRIDSSGNLLVGTTSNNPAGRANSSKFVVSQTAGDTSTFVQNSNSYVNMVSWVNTTSATRYHISFGDGSTYGERGVISTNGTGTTYGTNSDYRLKENIAPMTGALSVVAKLKPVTYKWKSDGSDGQGFIAHELQAVVPECVVGEKDAVDENGNPKYQGIDTSFLVATLTAAIQELKAINDQQAETINALTARVVALEAK